VGAGYSRFDHDTTCSHKAVVCLWGIFKRNFKPTRPETIAVPVLPPSGRTASTASPSTPRSHQCSQWGPTSARCCSTTSRGRRSRCWVRAWWTTTSTRTASLASAGGHTVPPGGRRPITTCSPWAPMARSYSGRCPMLPWPRRIRMPKIRR
jgi:hypothetical protein